PTKFSRGVFSTARSKARSRRPFARRRSISCALASARESAEKSAGKLAVTGGTPGGGIFSAKQTGEMFQRRIVGQIEAQRRDRNLVLRHRFEIGAGAGDKIRPLE